MNDSAASVELSTKTTNSFLLTIVGFVIAAAGGALIPIMSLPTFVGIVLAPVILVICAIRPSIGALVALALIFEVIPADYQPALRAGGGYIKLYDFLVWYVATVIGIRILLLKQSSRNSVGLFYIPLGFLFFILVISFAYSTLYLHNHAAISEARELAIWIMVPILAYSLNSQQDQRVFVRGLLAIGVALSCISLLQSIFGIRIMSSFRVEALDTDYSNVTRSLVGGGIYIIIFSLLYAALTTLENRRRAIWTVPLMILFLGGLAVSFGRAIWVSTFLAILCAAFWTRGWRGFFTVVTASVVSLGCALSILSVTNPTFVGALLDRALGMGKEINAGHSIQWRKVENREALQVIMEKPLTGVGIGGEYKKVKTPGALALFPIENRFIHNGYLFFPLKFGVLGILFPVLMIITFFWKAYRIRRNGCISPQLLYAAMGTFVVLIITSMTEQGWSTGQIIGAFCCCIAILCFLQPDEKKFFESQRTRQGFHL